MLACSAGRRGQPEACAGLQAEHVGACPPAGGGSWAPSRLLPPPVPRHEGGAEQRQEERREQHDPWGADGCRGAADRRVH